MNVNIVTILQICISLDLSAISDEFPPHTEPFAVHSGIAIKDTIIKTFPTAENILSGLTFGSDARNVFYAFWHWANKNITNKI